MFAVKTCLILFFVLTFFDLLQCARYGGSAHTTSRSIGHSTKMAVTTSRPITYRTTPRSTTRRTTTPRSTTKRTTTQPWWTTTTRSTTRRTTTQPWWTTTTRSTTRRTTTTPRSTTRKTTTQPWTTTRSTTRRTTTQPWTTTRSTTRRATTQPWTTTKSTTPRTTTRSTTPRTTTRSTTPRTTTRSTTRRTTTQPWTTPKSTTRRTTTRSTTRTTTRPIIRTSTVRPFNALPPLPSSGKYGKTDFKLVNKHTVVFPGYYPIPVPSREYPGYVRTVTSYHYTPSQTGDTAFGYFLALKLKQLTTPTYSHVKFYDGYRPRYDHYEVHHYYHNSESIPKQQKIKSVKIIGCVGDSTTVCPINTTSLCTSDGRLMCVVPVAALTDCKNMKVGKCVKSTIRDTIEDIPCVSTLKIEGDIQYVNGTIMKSTPSVSKTLGNSTNNCSRSTVSCVNSTGSGLQTSNCTTITVSCNATSTKNCTITTVSCISTVGMTNKSSNCNTSVVSCIDSTNPECAKIMNTTCVLQSGTISTNYTNNSNTSSASCINSTNVECAKILQNGNKYVNGTTPNCTTSTTNGTTSGPCEEEQVTMKYINSPNEIGTTVVPTTKDPESVHWKWKRSIPSQDFCVTLVLVPARRVPSQGEEFLKDATGIFEMFIEKAWGL